MKGSCPLIVASSLSHPPPPPPLPDWFLAPAFELLHGNRADAPFPQLRDAAGMLPLRASPRFAQEAAAALPSFAATKGLCGACYEAMDLQEMWRGGGGGGGGIPFSTAPGTCPNPVSPAHLSPPATPLPPLPRTEVWGMRGSFDFFRYGVNSSPETYGFGGGASLFHTVISCSGLFLLLFNYVLAYRLCGFGVWGFEQKMREQDLLYLLTREAKLTEAPCSHRVRRFATPHARVATDVCISGFRFQQSGAILLFQREFELTRGTTRTRPSLCSSHPHHARWNSDHSDASVLRH